MSTKKFLNTQTDLYIEGNSEEENELFNNMKENNNPQQYVIKYYEYLSLLWILLVREKDLNPHAFATRSQVSACQFRHSRIFHYFSHNRHDNI